MGGVPRRERRMLDLREQTHPHGREFNAWEKAMSTDYYLISRKARRRVQVGSIGISGIFSYPGEASLFIEQAIESRLSETPWDDIQFLSEHQCDHIMDEDEWTEEEMCQ